MSKVLLVLPVLVAACVETPSYRPQPGLPDTPVAFESLQRAGDAPIVIATGGVEVISISDPASIGVSGESSDGFEIDPHDHAWPNMKQATYALRALQPGDGDFAIATDHGIASGPLAAADVARVALASTSPVVRVALYDAGGNRLVDGTLAIADDQPGATAAGWDGLALAATHGAHTLTVTADSIAPQQFTIDN